MLYTDGSKIEDNVNNRKCDITFSFEKNLLHVKFTYIDVANNHQNPVTFICGTKDITYNKSITCKFRMDNGLLDTLLHNERKLKNNYIGEILPKYGSVKYTTFGYDNNVSHVWNINIKNNMVEICQQGYGRPIITHLVGYI